MTFRLACLAPCLLIVGSFGIGCRKQVPAVTAAATLSASISSASATPVGDDLPADGEVTALLEPYREQMQAVMEDQIGTAEATIGRGRPESALGNLVVDALFVHALEADPSVELALMNHGGIRLPQLPEGAITVADIYQLVPFDNRVVVLTLSGRQLAGLISQLAANGGEPLAGCTYRLGREDHAAMDIRVGGVPLDTERPYRLATLDYLASVGGDLAVLKEVEHQVIGKGFIRDVVIEYIRQRGTIRPTLDGRVSYDEPN